MRKYLCPNCLGGINTPSVKIGKILGGGTSWLYATLNETVLGSAHEDDKEGIQHLRDIQDTYPLIRSDTEENHFACNHDGCQSKSVFKSKDHFKIPKEIEDLLSQGVQVINRWGVLEDNNGVEKGLPRLSGVLSNGNTIITLPVVDVTKYEKFWVVTTQSNGCYAELVCGNQTGDIKKSSEPMKFIMGREHKSELAKDWSIGLLANAVDNIKNSRSQVQQDIINGKLVASD